MEFSGSLFSTEWRWFFFVLYLAALWKAVQWADWQRLRDSGQFNVFLGAAVCMLVLWTMRTDIQPGFFWHLSGVVSLTLMFGWSLAVLSASLSMIGITLAGLNDWGGFLPSVVVQVLVPASVTQIVLGLARLYLPKHFFVYVFINAFLTGGLAAIIMALVGTAVLLLVDAYSLAFLQEAYLPFLPLMFFPEAVLNGWIVAILTVFRPDWVGSFRDEEYLKGK